MLQCRRFLFQESFLAFTDVAEDYWGERCIRAMSFIFEDVTVNGIQEMYVKSSFFINMIIWAYKVKNASALWAIAVLKSESVSCSIVSDSLHPHGL